MTSTNRTIAAPPAAAWALLVDTRRWNEWGPTVSAVECDPPVLNADSTGRVRTPVGLWLPFRVVDFVEGRHWSWRVLGVPATSHDVQSVGDGSSCVVSFSVPALATPYLAVCRIALGRIERILTR